MLFANEQALVAARPVFELMGADRVLGMDNPRLLLRPGGHHGLDDIDGNFDFFARAPAELLPPRNELLTAAGFRWSEWASRTPPLEDMLPPAPSAPLLERVRWLLDSSLEPSTSSGDLAWLGLACHDDLT